MFILIQLSGIVAWIFLISSYYMRDTKRIIIVQIISTLFYCLNYVLLGAYGGLLINGFEIVRDCAYYKTDKDDLIFLCTIPLYILIGYFTGHTFIALLPVIASVMDAFSLTKKRKFVIFTAMITNFMWFIYDYSILAYSCSITDLILVLSNLSILTLGYSKLIRNDKLLITNRHNINNITFTKLKKLDEKYYDKNLLWDLDYQKELYNKNKNSYTLITDNNKIIGYINYLCVSKKEYENYIRSEEMIIKYDTQDIVNYSKDNANYIIIDSIVMSTNYQNYKSVTLCSDDIKEFLKNKFKRGFNILGVSAISTTDFEAEVLEKTNFYNIRDLDTDYTLYVCDKEVLSELLNKKVKKSMNKLDVYIGSLLSDTHIDEIYDLDKTFFDKKYLWKKDIQKKLFKKNRDSVIGIIDNGDLIGYINFLPISKDKYNEIKKSNKIIDNYKEKDIIPYSKEKKNYITINSVVILKKYQNTKVIKLLTDNFKKSLKKLNKMGYTIGGINTTAISLDGRKFADELGFKRYKKLEDGNLLYTCENNYLKSYLDIKEQD